MNNEIGDILKTSNEFEVLKENLKAKSKTAYEAVETACDFIKNGQDYINIYHEPIGNLGAKIISQIGRQYPNVSHIVIGFCKIGVDGARALSNLMKACPKLKGISFGKFMGNEVYKDDSNDFKVDGTKAIADGLRFSAVELLDLG